MSTENETNKKQLGDLTMEELDIPINEAVEKYPQLVKNVVNMQKSLEILEMHTKVISNYMSKQKLIRISKELANLLDIPKKKYMKGFIMNELKEYIKNNDLLLRDPRDGSRRIVLKECLDSLHLIDSSDLDDSDHSDDDTYLTVTFSDFKKLLIVNRHIKKCKKNDSNST